MQLILALLLVLLAAPAWADGTITLSTPQPIAPSSSPQFTGLSLSGLGGSGDACVAVNSAGVLGRVACSAAGVSSLNGLTGAITITPTTNQTTVTTSSGLIRVGTVQDIATVSSPLFANLTLSGNPAVGVGASGLAQLYLAAAVATGATQGNALFINYIDSSSVAGARYGIVSNITENQKGSAWGLFTGATLAAGSDPASNVESAEHDVFNNARHLGDADAGSGLAQPVAYGLTIWNTGSFRSTAALAIAKSGAAGWNRGIVIAGDAITATGSAVQDLSLNLDKSIDIRGTPNFGIYQNQPNSAGGGRLLNYFSGYVDLHNLSRLRFFAPGEVNSIGFQAQSMSSPLVVNWFSTPGTNGQCLITDGASPMTMSWGACGTGGGGGTGINSLNGLSAASAPNQTVVNDLNVGWTSTGSTHTFTWLAALPLSRGGTGLNLSASNGALVVGSGFSTALVRSLDNGQLLIGTGFGFAPVAGSLLSGTLSVVTGAGSLHVEIPPLTIHGIVLGKDPAGIETLTSTGLNTQVLHGNAAGIPSWAPVNLQTDVTGNLPVANLNFGAGANSTTAWFGDGTWKAVPSIGGVSGTPGQVAVFSGPTTITSPSDNGLGYDTVGHVLSTYNLRLAGPSPWTDVSIRGASPSASAATNQAAIQAAIDALPSTTCSVLYIPAGLYQHQGAWQINRKCIFIRGDGYTTELRDVTSSGGGFTAITSGTDIRIENLAITTAVAQSASTGLAGIDSSVPGANCYLTVRHVYIVNMTYGIRSTQCHVTVENSKVTFFNQIGIQSQGLNAINNDIITCPSTFCSGATGVAFPGAPGSVEAAGATKIGIWALACDVNIQGGFHTLTEPNGTHPSILIQPQSAGGACVHAKVIGATIETGLQLIGNVRESTVASNSFSDDPCASGCYALRLASDGSSWPQDIVITGNYLKAGAGSGGCVNVNQADGVVVTGNNCHGGDSSSIGYRAGSGATRTEFLANQINYAPTNGGNAFSGIPYQIGGGGQALVQTGTPMTLAQWTAIGAQVGSYGACSDCNQATGCGTGGTNPGGFLRIIGGGILRCN